MNVQPARIVGDQVKCWHCPAVLGQLVPRDGGGWLLGAKPLYLEADVPEAVTAAGIRSVLIIPPRAKDRLRRTGLPYRRRRSMDAQGGIRMDPAVLVALPALVPCSRPGCGVPNRVDIATAND